jgi:hypothetical protein
MCDECYRAAMKALGVTEEQAEAVEDLIRRAAEAKEEEPTP